MSGARPTPEGRGVLYVVATPIGNLSDLTLRALEVLREADLILCEDTRTTRKLLTHYGIRGKRLLSLYKDNERRRLPQILKALAEGQKVALVSEAGTPGISDPGALVVSETRRAGFPVVPVPGPSALTAFLSVCGRDLSGGFLFLGFPPPRSAERRRLLAELKEVPYPLVFFVPPHRLRTFLGDLLAVLGDRPAILGRELTKVFEEVVSGRVSQFLERYSAESPRGEILLLVEPALPEKSLSAEKILAEVQGLQARGLSLKKAVKEVASRYGLSSKELYRRMIEKKRPREDSNLRHRD
ncbi:16S rRNA (cytidine(1402)-2'-O)-methyltransferase [Thermosulfurimonas marina]|uniref:Ribosomal RNA small subunit methyltransferase I n=1 Tax=Thermosulfurimonas marina TaxID=2047767 RepID=A0A6H1WS83_9BACT|nr:16S rRNA (cytidine(1402)-2'-O)-methyltransferase [Thermosulfurimonas marina]QJA06042.1 16S rRNA (cytidine(1402)-2'-O)-methyltransferase [Thermosulfurimonas marina]